MVRRICLMLMFGFIWGEVYGGQISGAVRGRLDVTHSPYVVTGDLIVSKGDTLRIDPGVVLYFDENVSLVVFGKLTAEGTVQDSILFLYGGADSTGHWGGIYFNGTEQPSRLSFVSLRGAFVGITIDASPVQISSSLFAGNVTAVDCGGSGSQKIIRNVFRRNTNAAIRVTAAFPFIAENRFFHNSLSGVQSVVVLNDSAGGIISRNIFADNGLSAIDCNGGSAPKIWHNTVVNNKFGITVQKSAPEIVNNLVYRNGSGLVMDLAGGKIAYNDVFANGSQNFFGGPDSVGVFTRVNARGDSCDAFFNFSKEPYLSDPEGGDFTPKMASPLIDAGDPTNPAGILFSGSAPDVGALETDYTFPVELTSFRFEEGKLVWTTASEQNNYGFAIWRANSAEMTGAVRIGFVAGHGTSASPHTYSFVDHYPESEIHYYRLEQMDVNGQSHWSPVVEACYALPTAADLRVGEPFPNPARGALSLPFRLQRPVSLKISVYDLLGRQVRRIVLRQEFGTGAHTLHWDGLLENGSPAPAGIYFVRFRTGRVQVVRKIVLRH